MTPKEKAVELYNWFADEGKHSYGRYQSTDIEDKEGAIYCALKTVDEIINYQPFDIYTIEQCMSVNKYWQEVKQEIEKL
jgi:hypothetical protein